MPAPFRPEIQFYEINGERVGLTPQEVARYQRYLVSQVRLNIWLPERNTFDNMYGQWRAHHDRAVFTWICEHLDSGPNLPSESDVNRVKRARDRLDRLVTPTGVSQFFADLPSFVRASAHLRRRYWEFTHSWERGGERAVQGLTLVRNTCIETLVILATLPAGPASAAAVEGAVAAEGAAAAGAAGAEGMGFVGSVASNFLVNMTESLLDDLSGMVNGDEITEEQFTTQLLSAGIGALSDAVLGQIFQGLLPDASRGISEYVSRSIRSGNLLRGVAAEQFAMPVIQAAVMQVLQAADITTIRGALSEVQNTDDQASACDRIARYLVERDRRFRDAIGRQLEEQSRRRR